MSGIVYIFNQKGLKRYMSTGNYFGEAALKFVPRGASAVAV